jgi:CheY-like chemotaxis protein
MDLPQTPRPPGVLVLDDEPSVRRMLQTALGLYGFRVWAAATGAEAVALFATHRGEIDVALLDVLLAGMGGPQTMAALRRLEPGLPCCLMSGGVDEPGREALRAKGPGTSSPSRWTSTRWCACCGRRLPGRPRSRATGRDGGRAASRAARPDSPVCPRSPQGSSASR